MMGKRMPIIMALVCIVGVALFVPGSWQPASAVVLPANPSPAPAPGQNVIIKRIPDLRPVSLDKTIIPGKINLKPGQISGLQIQPEKAGALSAKPSGIWNPPMTRSGTVFILVSEKIWHLDQLMPTIRTYAEDVARDGYKVLLYKVSFEGTIDPYFSHVRNLKSFIQSKWLQTLGEVEKGGLSREAFNMGTGVVLVGKFPLPLLHKRMATTEDDPDAPGQTKRVLYEGVMPCDLYLTDMDGSWNILDEYGIPLVSTVDAPTIPQDSECVPGDEIHPSWQPQAEWGKAGARPEIWIGRIDPSRITSNETEDFAHYRSYFQGNHTYRTGMKTQSAEKVGEYTFENRLLYYDDDMEDLASEGAAMISLAWPSGGTTQIVNAPATTTKADYLNRLKNNNFLWVEAFMHSSPALHQFSIPEGKEVRIENLPWNELFQGQRIRALFYFHHGCSVCRYSERHNLGEEYLFDRTAVPGGLHPMAVLGNTSVGPHDTATFYAGLAFGMNIGQAQMLSQRAFARQANWPSTFPAIPGRVDPKRYYNQTLLGDPTLRPRAFSPLLEPTPPNLVSVYGIVKGRFGILFPTDLKRLQTRGISSKSVPTRKVAELFSISAFPTGKGGIVIDPQWGRIGIPGLKKRLSSELSSR